MSSLPIAQFCARGPALAQMGAGRAAAQSSVFHALCADPDDPKAKAALARLSDDEAQELIVWRKPTDVQIDVGGMPITLTYAQAHKEVAVGLTKDGSYCEPDDEACVSVGHLDFAWTFEANGFKVGVVGDLKRSEWTVKEGTDSLQLWAYLLAWCDKHGCDHGFAGLWSLTEGLWQFGPMVDMSMFSDVRSTMVDRVVASALNTEGDYSMGSHCNGCYGRLRCPAYLMPPEVAETSLGAFTSEEALRALSPAELGALVEQAKRAKATVEAMDKAIKAAVYAGVRVELDGKVYKPVQTKGRASLDAKALEHDMPEVAQKYTKIGAPFDTFRWVKA